MSEPTPQPVPWIHLRLSRWITIAGIITMCASMFMTWYEFKSGATYAPVTDLLKNRSWIETTYPWPFMLLALYGFLGEVGGRRGRSVVTWVASFSTGLSALAISCISLNHLMHATKIYGLGHILDAVRNAPAIYLMYAVYAVGGFVLLAVPLLRPSRAALPACVALCGFLVLTSTAAYFATAYHVSRDFADFRYSAGYWVHGAGAAAVLAGGIWEFLIERRRGEPEKKGT